MDIKSRNRHMYTVVKNFLIYDKLLNVQKNGGQTGSNILKSGFISRRPNWKNIRILKIWKNI
jgi:hypothetical protein